MKMRLHIFALGLGLWCCSIAHADRPLMGSQTEFVARASIVSPTTVSLNWGANHLSKQSVLQAIPQVHLGLSRLLGMSGGLEVRGEVGMAYGSKSGVLSVLTQSSGDQGNMINLHMVPLYTAFRFSHSIPGIDFVRPCLTVGGGAQWIYQSVSPSPLEGGIWIPYGFIKPSLHFLEPSQPDDMFGGFLFGVSLFSSLGHQTFRGWSFDLSLTLIL